jgi:large repetitive protein
MSARNPRRDHEPLALIGPLALVSLLILVNLTTVGGHPIGSRLLSGDPATSPPASAAPLTLGEVEHLLKVPALSSGASGSLSSAPSPAGSLQSPPDEVSSPNPVADGNFGYSVAMSGTTVVVGAPLEAASGKVSAGHAYIVSTNSGLVITLASPNGQKGANFGLSVAISGATVVVGAPLETASGKAGAGHAYTFNATTGDLISTLTSPNTHKDGEFGDSVAVSGTTVVVGAPGETVSGESGAGHAYTFSTVTGDLISRLTSPNAQADGTFGASVAISGTTVAVGAPRELVSGDSGAGQTYLISTRSGHASGLASPSAQSNGAFGGSVAINGSTVVVGAPGEMASGASAAGHAYAFGTTTNGLISTFTSPNAQEFGEFGFSVALSGGTVAVGAPFESVSGQTGAGRAYTFLAPSGDLIEGNLTSPSAPEYGYLGWSVAMSGSTTVVAAPTEAAEGLAAAGHVYLFDSDLPWTITSPNAQDAGFLGISVASSGSTVVVGASGEMAAGLAEAGHAYIIGTKTGLVLTLTSPNAQTDGYFGQSVAISGTTVLVGAWGEAASGDSGAGHAYAFSALTGDLISTFTSPHAQAGGGFGISVAMSGTTVVVGAWNETASGDSGAGHAYAFSAVTDDLLSTFTSPNAQANGNFGFSVAISGSTVVVGTYNETASGDRDAGHAYTFNATTGGRISTFTSPNAQVGGSFGTSVAISGTTVVVGAWGEAVSGDGYAGHVYLFNTKTGLVRVLTSPNAIPEGLFGRSVAISGSTVVVGASGETASGHADAGNVYTFSVGTGDPISSWSSPNAQGYGYFGASVAMSGTTVVVGAYYEIASGVDTAGHAYIL